MTKGGETEHVLTGAQRYTIDPEIIRAARSEAGWTLFEVNSYPGWTPGGCHVASEAVIEDLKNQE